MLRHAIINQVGEIVNTIIWDGKTNWKPPKDHIVVQHDRANIGDVYDHDLKEITHIFRVSPDPIAEEEPQLSLDNLKKQIDELRQLISKG